MSGLRRLAAVGAVAALALLGAGSAFAATPQKIYRDLADNGRLDGKYTRAEIERAFNLRQVLRTDEQPTTAPRKPIAVAPAGETGAASSREAVGAAGAVLSARCGPPGRGRRAAALDRSGISAPSRVHLE